jgi:hypothetical protein
MRELLYQRAVVIISKPVKTPISVVDVAMQRLYAYYQD